MGCCQSRNPTVVSPTPKPLTTEEAHPPEAAHDQVSTSPAALCAGSPPSMPPMAPLMPLASLEPNTAVEASLPSTTPGGETVSILVLLESATGKVHAVTNSCPHKAAVLTEGAVVDVEDLAMAPAGGVGHGTTAPVSSVVLRCKRHRQTFAGDGLYINLNNGGAMAMGPTPSMKPHWCVDTFDTKVLDGVVHVATDPRPRAPGTTPREEVEEEAFVLRPWRVTNVVHVTHDAREYHLESVEALPGLPVAFKPTDLWHVWVAVTIGGVTREYTPLSNLDTWKAGKLRFLIKLYPNGALTGPLAKVVPGDFLQVGTPEPTLQVPSLARPDAPGVGPAADQIALIFGGTGVTPMMQLMDLGLPLGGALASAKWWVLTSNHTPKDVLCKDRMDDLDRTLTDFHVAHTVTRVSPPDWPGFTGRVSVDMLRTLFDGDFISPSVTRRVVMCGPMPFMQAVRKLLVSPDIGMAEEDIVLLDA